jgi:hypothetical protein
MRKLDARSGEHRYTGSKYLVITVDHRFNNLSKAVESLSTIGDPITTYGEHDFVVLCSIEDIYLGTMTFLDRVVMVDQGDFIRDDAFPSHLAMQVSHEKEVDVISKAATCGAV